MLSVRPSRCYSDTVCFSQVLLGNHSSPKPACLGASHRTQLLFSSQQTPCPFLCQHSFVLCFIPSLNAFTGLRLRSLTPFCIVRWEKKKNKLRETWFLNFISSYMHTHKGCQSPDILQVILFGSDHAWPHSTWVSAFCYWLLCCSPTHPHPPPNTHTHTQELLFWVQFCFSRTA